MNSRGLHTCIRALRGLDTNSRNNMSKLIMASSKKGSTLQDKNSLSFRSKLVSFGAAPFSGRQTGSNRYYLGSNKCHPESNKCYLLNAK